LASLLSTFCLTQVDDQLCGKRNLLRMTNDESRTMIKDKVHLAFSRMSDFDLDEHRICD